MLVNRWELWDHLPGSELLVHPHGTWTNGGKLQRCKACSRWKDTMEGNQGNGTKIFIWLKYVMFKTLLTFREKNWALLSFAAAQLCFCHQLIGTRLRSRCYISCQWSSTKYDPITTCNNMIVMLSILAEHLCQNIIDINQQKAICHLPNPAVRSFCASPGLSCWKWSAGRRGQFKGINRWSCWK